VSCKSPGIDIAVGRFCGLTRSSPSSVPVLQSEAQNWVYRYESGTKQGKWTQISRCPSVSLDSSHDIEEPQARYAHQVVFDPKRNLVFMFGGNAGLSSRKEKTEPATSGTEDASDMGDTGHAAGSRDTADIESRDGEGEGGSGSGSGGGDGDNNGDDDVNMEDDVKTEKGDDPEEKEDVTRLDDLWSLSLRR
jgi:hypothetical protein